jgi:hypothetical protein
MIAEKGKGKRAEIEIHAEILPSIYPCYPVNSFQLNDDPIDNLLESRPTKRVRLPSSCNRVPSTAAFAGNRIYGWLVSSGGDRGEKGNSHYFNVRILSASTTKLLCTHPDDEQNLTFRQELR